MSERWPVAPPDAMPAAARLNREAAILAGRLADLLAATLPDAGGQLAQGIGFLQSMFAGAAEGRPLAQWTGGPLDRRPATGPDPLDRIADGLGLSPVEVDLLLLGGLADAHEGYASVLRCLHPRGEPAATVGLAAQLFCHSADERHLLRERLENGSAVRAGALRVAGEAPFPERSLYVAEALWSALSGIDAWPAAVARLRAPVVESGLQAWLASPPAARARAALESGGPRTVLVTADGVDMALHRATALVQHAGVTGIPIALPYGPGAELEQLCSLHCLARAAVPILRLAPPPDGQPPAPAPEFATHPAPVVIAARAGAAPLRGVRPVVAVFADGLSPTARREMWVGALPELESHAAALAARYSIEPVTALEAATDARSIARLEQREPGLDDVATSVRTRTALTFTGGVKLVHPTATWQQLVLDTECETQLREAAGRRAHQARVLDEWGFLAGRPGARGVRLLFAGPPGTGKTLSAEVLAHELGVELLFVDISRVVSKWIGETEKNLAEVFDVAERAQAVLLFDEADALFGKRTEVTDAHDRYANLETAYLLMRLERFDGLAILSTNFRQNLDPAFLRRLDFVVDFDEPGLANRIKIWRCHLPPGAPLAEDVSLHDLATLYPVAGGFIRNAAVAAGFLAASDGTAITRHHLVRAIRREYEKTGRAFPGFPAGMALAS